MYPRFTLGILSLLFATVLSAQSQTPRRSVTRVDTSQSASGVTITVYYDDGLCLVLRPQTAGSKSADLTDVLSALNLLSGKVPAVSGAPAGVGMSAIENPHAKAANPKDSKDAKEMPATLETVRNAMATIIADNNQPVGAAILIKKDRLVTTANLGTAKRVRIRFPGGAQQPADVLVSQKNMMTALSVDSGGREPVPYDETGDAPKDLEGWVVSSPYGVGEPVQQVKIVATNVTARGWENMFVRLDRPIHTSNTGAAILNQQGKVVGLVCAWPDEQETLGIPISLVSAFVSLQAGGR